jgi:biotin carboxylase
MTRAQRPLVGVVSPMGRVNREHLLRALAERYRVWVFDDEERDWSARYASGHTVVNTRSAVDLFTAASGVGLDAVLTWDELSSIATAELAAALDLPGPPPDAVRRCRDKYLTRVAMAEHGRPSRPSVSVATCEQALAAAKWTGFPAVLKPRSLTGSIGPVLVHSADRLVEVFPQVRAAHLPGLDVLLAEPLVLESYLDGPEISVDSVVVAGETHVAFLAHKRLGYPPYFEEVGHVVDAEDPLLDDPVLLERLSDAHRAVGFDQGWTHTEWRLTAATGPELVEINPRIGGDLISQLGTVATGLEPSVLAAQAALGGDIDAAPRFRRAAAVRFVYPERSMRLGAIDIDRDRLPEGTVRVEAFAEPGDWLHLPPQAHGTGRAVVVMCTGERGVDAERAAEAAEAAVRLVDWGENDERSE